MLVPEFESVAGFSFAGVPAPLESYTRDEDQSQPDCKSQRCFSVREGRRQDKRLSRRNGLNRRQCILPSRAVGSQGCSSDRKSWGMTQRDSEIANHLLPMSSGPYSHAEYLASVGRLRDTLKAIPVGSFIRNVFKAGAGQAPRVPPRFTITGIL